MMGPEFRVRSADGSCPYRRFDIGDSVSRPPGRRRRRRGGHADQPAASRFASDGTRDRADMGPRRAAAPVLTFIEPSVGSIGLPIVRCPLRGPRHRIYAANVYLRCDRRLR